MNELQIPDTARQDPHSFELLRVWVANKSQHVSVRTGVWKDPAAWGIMLSDLMQHIANALEQCEGISRDKALERILAGFNAESGSPTDRPTGA